MKKIEDYPEIKAILDKCADDIQAVAGKKCYVKFTIKFRDIDTDTMRRIICRVCQVTWEQVVGDVRGGPVIIARHLYCYFARFVQKKSFPQIGTEINRAHMTVMASCERMQNMIDTKDDLYMHYINSVEALINKHYEHEAQTQQQ